MSAGLCTLQQKILGQVGGLKATRSWLLPISAFLLFSIFLIPHFYPLHPKYFFEKILPHKLVAGGVRVEIVRQIFGEAFVKELETVYVIDVLVAAPFDLASATSTRICSNVRPTTLGVVSRSWPQIGEQTANGVWGWPSRMVAMVPRTAGRKATRAKASGTVDVDADLDRDKVRRQIADQPGDERVGVALAAEAQRREVEVPGASYHSGPSGGRRSRGAAMGDRAAIRDPLQPSVFAFFAMCSLWQCNVAHGDGHGRRQPNLHGFLARRQALEADLSRASRIRSGGRNLPADAQVKTDHLQRAARSRRPIPRRP